MKHKEKAQLYLTFLDLEKAYDSVSHAKLWQKLEDVPLDKGFIELLKALYADCTAIYDLHGHKSQKVNLKVGLKQGCPLSPTLFNLFINNLLRTLNDKRPGLRLSTITTDNREVYTKISCLAFADDIVLLAESATDLQDLLEICSQGATEDHLKFNTEKTQWMSLSTDSEEATFTLQGKHIKKTATYRYLGIEITDKKDYLEKQAELVTKKLNRQNELGRWLLGGNFCTSNAAITGEMGWSPFEIREARSKFQYMGRLKFLPETNFSSRIYLHLRYKGIKTLCMQRLATLE